MSSVLLFRSSIQHSPVNSSPHICMYGKEARPLFVYGSGFWLDSSSQTPPPVSYLTKLEAVSLAHGWSCGMCKWVALTIGQPKPLRDPARPPCTDFLLHHSDCKNRRFPFVSLGRSTSLFPAVCKHDCVLKCESLKGSVCAKPVSFFFLLTLSQLFPALSNLKLLLRIYHI